MPKKKAGGLVAESDAPDEIDELADLALKLVLLHLHPLVAHRLVLARVGADLGPVEGNVAELNQAGFAAKLADLDELAGQGFEVASSKLANGVVVGMLVGGDHGKATSS